MKILIFDDMPERHEGFIKIFKGQHELTHSWTFSQAVKAMNKTKFGMVCLDHDLGDNVEDNNGFVHIKSEHFNLSFRPEVKTIGMYSLTKTFLDGRDVCQWMVQNEFKCPPKVLVHSWNIEMAKIMGEVLSSISWLEILIKPFREPE